jgi:ADP-L-glycero-D-manno-heptose 6-epimerase
MVLEKITKVARPVLSIKIFEGSEHSRRDFVPVQDVVAMHLKFLTKPTSGIYNIGTGQTQSFREIAEQFNVPIDEIPMPENLKNSYQRYTCADMTRTNQALNG